MKFSIKDFFSKCDQIHRRMLIWLHLLKKSLLENFICCAVKSELKRCKRLKRKLFYNCFITARIKLILLILIIISCKHQYGKSKYICRFVRISSALVPTR